MSKNACLPLRFRIRYMFSGYKTQNLLNTVGKKILICVLAILLTLPSCYIFLHPVNKVKVKYFFTRNCTIEVSVRATVPVDNFLGAGNTEILIDGDWMKVGGTYYKLENGEIYCYRKDGYGEWQKKLYEKSADMSEDIRTGSELLKRSNYKRAKGSLFVWELREDVAKEIKGLSSVKVKRFNGDIAIVGDYYYLGDKYKVYICFTKFGSTEITLPWEN